RQLTADGQLTVGVHSWDGARRRRRPARRLEHDRRPGPPGQFLPDPTQRLLAPWKETEELIALGGETARDEGGIDGGRTRQNRHGHTGFERGGDEPSAGVGDARQACVGHERYALTGLKTWQHLRGSRGLVVLVVGAQSRADPVPFEQPPRVPRVLAEDEVGLGELAQHPQRDVLEVADRGRANRKHQPAEPSSSYATSAAPITPAAVPSSARTIWTRPRAGGSASRRIVSRAGSSRKSPAEAKPPPMTTSWGLKMFTKLPTAAPSFRPISSRISTAVESP